jgi:hypothetical protein
VPRLGSCPAPTRRKRRTLPKVRTGCLTCKFRRVKCGEERPSCLRCINFGTSCSYALDMATKNGSYCSVFSVSHSAPISQEVSPLPHIDIEDGYQYFELFRSTTSIEFLIHTSDAVSIRLILLQAGAFRQSIRYALAALGALEKVSERAPTLPYNDNVSIPSLCLASLVLQCWAFQTVFHLPRFLIFEIIQILIYCSGKLVTNTIGMHSDYIIELLHI